MVLSRQHHFHRANSTDYAAQVYNWEPHKDVCYKLYIEERKV